MNEWYVAKGEEWIGPLSEDLIRRGIMAGKLDGDVQVTRQGSTVRALSATSEFGDLFVGSSRRPAAAPPQGPAARGPLPLDATQTLAAVGLSKERKAGRLARVGRSLASPHPALVGLWAVALLGAAGVCAWKLVRGGAVDPRDVEAELRSVMLDREAIRRAVRCEELLADEAEFQVGKPYVVEQVLGDHCKVVSKGKPDAHLHGGYLPSPLRECKGAAEEAPRHENNLDAKIQIACGPQRKPSLEPDASVRLATELEVHGHLARTVKDVNAGAVSSRIGQCYFNTKARLIASGEDVQRERCEVLKKVSAVKGVTYDAIFTAARLSDALERYKKEHVALYEEHSKKDKVTAFYDLFLAHEQALACSSATKVTVADQDAASGLAISSCL